MPFRAESSFAGKAYSARKPFPFHVCTRKAAGSGNKRPTEKSIQQKKQHTDSRKIPVRMLFWFSIGVYRRAFFWKRRKKAGGKLRSLQKINPFFRPPANIRPPCPAELLLPSFAVFIQKILRYKVSQVIWQHTFSRCPPYICCIVISFLYYLPLPLL